MLSGVQVEYHNQKYFREEEKVKKIELKVFYLLYKIAKNCKFWSQKLQSTSIKSGNCLILSISYLMLVWWWSATKIKIIQGNYLCSKLSSLVDFLPGFRVGASFFYVKNFLEMPQISFIIWARSSQKRLCHYFHALS